MRKTVIITLLTFIVSSFNLAYAGNFKLVKGKQFPLCQEVQQILDAPENKDIVFSESKLERAEFIIPKRFKNFFLPKWEAVPTEDINKYIAKNKQLEDIQNFNIREKQNLVQIEVQKTIVDLDNNGTGDIILRFKRDDTNRPWTCYASDITPNSMTSNYNKFPEKCMLFSYKRRIFHITYFSASSTFGIFEPHINPDTKIFGMSEVCEFKSKIEK